MCLSCTQCPRDFNKEWFPYLFGGDPQAVKQFVETHCRDRESTDERGLIIMATVEALKVDVRIGLFSSFPPLR